MIKHEKTGLDMIMNDKAWLDKIRHERQDQTKLYVIRHDKTERTSLFNKIMQDKRRFDMKRQYQTRFCKNSQE
jgi:hypothetical protein